MTDIFIAYITITIFGVVVVGLFDLHHKKRPVVSERQVFDCPVCAYRYIVDVGSRIHRCPQCNSLNEG